MITAAAAVAPAVAELLETYLDAARQAVASIGLPPGIPGVEACDGEPEIRWMSGRIGWIGPGCVGRGDGDLVAGFQQLLKWKLTDIVHALVEIRKDWFFADPARCESASGEGWVDRLNAIAKLVVIGHSAQEHEHPEPIWLAPGLPLYVGVRVRNLEPTIRIPIGVVRKD